MSKRRQHGSRGQYAWGRPGLARQTARDWACFVRAFERRAAKMGYAVEIGDGFIRAVAPRYRPSTPYRKWRTDVKRGWAERRAAEMMRWPASEFAEPRA